MKSVNIEEELEEANTAVWKNQAVAVIEKDYYVTMILRLLAEKADKCVFKGGTSL